MGLVTQKNNLGPLTLNSYDVWDLCPAPDFGNIRLKPAVEFVAIAEIESIPRPS